VLPQLRTPLTLSWLQYMMKEREANRLFAAYKKKMVDLLGTKAQYGDVLDKVGRALFGTRFKGVYAQHQPTYGKAGYYIINTDTSPKGEHWVAVCLTQKTCYVFDTFGRQTKNILKHLYKKVRAQGKSVVDADYDKDQSETSAVCGQLCLAWLLVAKQHGVQAALLI
jgi:hypothetical protein